MEAVSLVRRTANQKDTGVCRRCQGSGAIVSLTPTCAVSALHFCYSHTKIGTPTPRATRPSYQNCPFLPILITRSAVASRLPPQVPINQPDELEFVDPCDPHRRSTPPGSRRQL